MIDREFQEMVEDSVRETLESYNTDHAQRRVRKVLEDWLLVTARKKPVANLEQLIASFRKRIEVLSESVTVSCKDGDLVVTATGDGESTLRMLERGTSWFEPAQDVKELIAGAILNE